MLSLPKVVTINLILSHLYPEDLENCKQASKEMKELIDSEEEYILGICQHIQPHGMVETFYYSGKSQKMFKDGEKHGEHKLWHGNDQLYKQKMFKDDEEYKEWYESGQLYIQSSYKDGVHHGEYKSWYVNGQLYKQNDV